MQLERAAIADGVFEIGVGDFGGHALFEDVEEFLSAGCVEVYGASGSDEIVECEVPIVDGGEDGGFGDDGPKFFHDVEGQGRTAEARLMVEADVGIEADGVGGKGAFLG